MTTYISSDHHFCHRNIIRYAGRPFSNVHNMNESMIVLWNSTVNPNDIVIYLGDFALASLYDIKLIRRRLNGDILLIKGNHDKSKRAMTEAGFKVINPFKIDCLVFSHKPLENVPKGYVNVHGHIHDKDIFYKGNYINVCVERTKYIPITLKSCLDRAKQMLIYTGEISNE